MDGVLMESNEAPDFAISDEVDVKTFATNAQSPTPGPQIQMIIKSGSNAFHGRVKEEYINSALDSTNITPLLISQGIKTGNNLLYSTDLMADVGGRIIKDKLWFCTPALRNEEKQDNGCWVCWRTSCLKLGRRRGKKFLLPIYSEESVHWIL